MPVRQLRGPNLPVPCHEASDVAWLRTDALRPSAFSTSIYGEPSSDLQQLVQSVREHGILVPLVVSQGAEHGTWEILSGHRRWACARALQIRQVPCQTCSTLSVSTRQQLILEYNRQRRKTFSQLMREADALEKLYAANARRRQLANLRKGCSSGTRSTTPVQNADRRNTDCRGGVDVQDARAPEACANRQRTDVALAERLGLGGKDTYRQARAVWRCACNGDLQAQSSVSRLDAGTKTIHAAYKDLRRKACFTTGFRPTPYDVWRFRRNDAFGLPYPGSTPAGVVAHTLHYFTPIGGLVVDPMAGGGTTYDVCQAMGRRCLAYDLLPVRGEICQHDLRQGLPDVCQGCDLIFCDPPYHTMLARSYPAGSVAEMPLPQWIDFLGRLATDAFSTLRPGGYLALLLAPQTEKDLPSGYGYLDHVFLGYLATVRAGFLPERRISCPMEMAYLPQHVKRARSEGRLLGQVRDLLIMRKPIEACASALQSISHTYLETVFGVTGWPSAILDAQSTPS